MYFPSRYFVLGIAGGRDVMMNKTDKIPILTELLFYCEIYPVGELPHSVLRTEKKEQDIGRDTESNPE